MSNITIELAFQASPQNGASSAVVDAIGRQIVSNLMRQNQRITPVYDGTRGGSLYQWLVETTQAAQPLLPLATLALTIAQLLNEVRKLKRETDRSAGSPPVVVVVSYGDHARVIPPDSDQALLEQLLSETLPDPIEPASLRIKVQVGAPSPPTSPWK